MRALLFAPQGLGDSLELTPLLSALRGAYEELSVSVVVLRGVARELFIGIPELVDEVIELPFWDGGRLPFLRAVLREGPRREYDLAILPYPAARIEYAVLQRLFRSRQRVTHAYRGGLVRRITTAGEVVVPIRQVHNVERNLDLLRALGVSVAAPDGYIVPKGWIDGARDQGLILIHPGTVAHDGLESRRWDPMRFAEIASRWIMRGYRVDAICGPSDGDAVEALRKIEPRVGLLTGRLNEVARAVSRADAVLANDSGIAHLAAGVRTPVLALFGPTPLEHAPYGKTARALRPSACPPCFDVQLLNTGCARGIDFACLKQDLNVDDVDHALSELIEHNAASELQRQAVPGD